MANTVPRKSLLQYSMEGGVWLGIYLIVRFACMVMGLYFPVANLLALALFVGTPFVLYRIIWYTIATIVTYRFSPCCG